MRKQSRHRKKKREVCSGEGEIQNVHFARYLLEAAIREDIQAGKKPFAIIGSLGTTNAL